MIRPQLRLDPTEFTRQRRHHAVGRRVLDQPVAIIPFARAVRAAVTREGGVVAGVAEGEVGRRSKVVDGVGGCREDLARGEGALVGFEVAGRVGKGKGVVPDLGGGGVAVGIEVEVGVLG